MEVLLLKIVVAVAPVLIFLAVFTLLDAFKLMSLGEVALLLVGGGVLVAPSYLLSGGMLDALPIGESSYSLYAAPFIEEGLKVALLLVLFARNRIGFTIDAAIVGFAVGAGFSVIENGYYLYYRTDANLGVWLVRGFGTALMHGGAAAMFASISQFMLERRLRGRASRFQLSPLPFVPGYLAAAALHSAFNHLHGAPVFAMTLILAIVPLTLFVIFSRSERASHRWLKEDFDTHEKLQADIKSGEFAKRHAFSERFHGKRLEMVLEYVELHTDLVVRAEAVLMAHRQGDDVVLEHGLAEQFDRLHALEKRLGQSVMMAVRQHLLFSRNDLWEMRELEEDARKVRA